MMAKRTDDDRKCSLYEVPQLLLCRQSSPCVIYIQSAWHGILWYLVEDQRTQTQYLHQGTMVSNFDSTDIYKPAAASQ